MTDFNQDDRTQSIPPQVIPPQNIVESPSTDNTRQKSLSSDELIALFLALTGIGSILFWTIAQKTSPINLSALTSGSSSFSNGALVGTPGATDVPQSSDGVPFTGTAQSAASTNSGNIAANPNATKMNAAVGTDGTTQNQTNASKGVNPTSEPIASDQSQYDRSDNTSASKSDNAAKTAAGVAAAGAIATIPTPTNPAPQKSATGTLDVPIQAKAFSDVPNDFWAKSAIVALSNRGVITGFSDGTFKPDQAINRAEFAGILQKAFDQQKSKPVMKFTDIKDNFWATGAIDEATQTGFMTGYPGGVFKPEQAIPRLEMLSAIATGLQLAPKGDPIQFLARYSDSKELPKWAVPKVSSAIEFGITIPNSTTLEPTKTATRADAAMFIYQALVKGGKIKP